MADITPLLTTAGQSIAPWLPKLGAAVAIVLVAWLVARLVRGAAVKAGERFEIDKKLGSAGLTASLAGVGAALVWLFALPALLGTFELNALLTPINAMMSRLMGFIPNLMGSAVVLGIGLLVARIVKQIVTGLLRAAGSERAAAKMGMAAALGESGLAGMAGNVVFVLLLLPTLVAALQPLGLDAVTTPLSKLLETVVNFVPRLVSAAIVVGLAVLVGRMAATLVTALASGLQIDKLPQKMGAPALELGGRSLSDLMGTGVMVAVVMTGLTQACDILQLQVLTDAVAGIGLAMVRVSSALVILFLGYLLASAVARGVAQRAHPGAAVQAMLTRAAILFFAAALALHQAGLPAVIVTIAFGAVVGGIAVGLAVAMGIGGGPVASRALERLALQLEGKAPGSPAAAPAQSPPTPVDTP
jgi:Conserved TM helix